MHAETRARLDRLVSRRNGEAPHNWAEELRRLADLPHGMVRLEQVFSVLSSPLDNERLDTLNSNGEIFVEWLTEALEEAAVDGAVLTEVRFGAKWGMRPGFMSLFREAESRVRDSHPTFFAEALVTGLWPTRPGALGVFEDSVRAVDEGLGGIDFIPIPYDEEADWTEANRWASKAADAGLGITVHVGEVSPANIEAGLGLPGVKRLGHALFATSTPQLLEQVLQSAVTVECCITSNLVFGGVSSLEEHPIGQLADAGVPVTLASDDPVRTCTSIGREYELARSLGFRAEELVGITRQTIRASFTSPDRKQKLFGVLDGALPKMSA